MKIKFYGAPWCSDCKRSMKYLADNKIDYEYINIEEDDKAADEVVRLNNGLRSIPTIVFPDGKILVEPTNDQLKQALAELTSTT